VAYNLAKLRILSDDAQTRRRKRLRVLEPSEDYKREKAKRFRKDEEERIKQVLADLIIEQIWDRMKLEGRFSRKHAIVYSFGTEEFKPPYSMPQNHRFETCSEGWLKGTARRVFEHCFKEKLNPTIERWSVGLGADEQYGFNIVVHWK
jgi:hypothetical protein